MDGADKAVELLLVIGAILALFVVLSALAFAEKENPAQKEALNKRPYRDRYEADEKIHRDHYEAEEKIRPMLSSIDFHHISFNYLSTKIEAVNNLATEATDPESEYKRLKHRTVLIKGIVREIKHSKYLLLARHENRLPDDKLFCPGWNGSQEIVKIRDYKVNLAQRTCTCDYMQGIDSSLPFEDIRRVCRHQVEAARSLDKLWAYRIGQIHTSYARAIMNKPWRERHYAVLRIPNWGTRMLSYDLPLEWVSIWIDNEKKFSYNLLKKDWSYGDSPRPHTVQARQAILDYFELSEFRKT